jgi:glutamate racemase
MPNTQASIGVFDSGMGGLTVLRALKCALPNESFIYLGDTARLPYGTKSPDTVRHYAMNMARILVERGIKALVVACNTATTAALSHLEAMLPDMPVVGVIVPGAEAAARMTQNKRIMVLATETTVQSKAYQTVIHEILPHAIIQARASSLLVALAEEGMVDDAIAEAVLKHYLSSRRDEDTLLLGCTHFPVFKACLMRLLPKGVHVVDSADATADALKRTLTQKNCLRATRAQGVTHYLVTDSVARFEQVGEVFLGESLQHQAIELVDA